jgi:predicted phosphoribosyltransferase
MDFPFADRREAGRHLATLLDDLRGRDDLIVLGLPRGGVPVAYEVARSLGAPLDVFVVRKLGVPGQEELAMGAIASGNLRVLNRPLIVADRIDDETIARAVEKERIEVERREARYRDPNAPIPDVFGRTVLLVDDGLATGMTMRAAVLAVRQRQPGQVNVAVPVGEASTVRDLGEIADRVVCAYVPSAFTAIGRWYEDFRQVSDGEVRGLLAAAGRLGPQ